MRKNRIPHSLFAIISAMLVASIILPAGAVSAAPGQAASRPTAWGMEISPPTYNFGGTDTGQSSTAHTFTILNTSGYTLDMHNAIIVTANRAAPVNDPNFAVQADNCAGQDLPDGSSCTVQVLFSPQSSGGKTAFLYVVGSPPDAPMVYEFAQLDGLGKTEYEITIAGTLSVGKTGDPVSTSVGEYYFDRALFDLGGPMSLQFALHYASQMRMGKIGGHNQPFGPDFSHNYHIALTQGSPDDMSIQYGPGDLLQFTRSNGDWQILDEEIVYQLKEDDVGAGYYYLLDPILEWVYTFEKDTARGVGHLTRIEDRNGNALAFANDDMGRVLSIEDGLGRSLVFSYSNPLPWIQPQLTQVVDQAGRPVQFDYESWGGNLTVVTDTMGLATAFTYTGSITDSVIAAQRLPRGNTPYRQTYARDPSDSAWRVTAQTDAYDNVTTLDFDEALGTTTITDPSGHAYEHIHQDQRLLTQWTDTASKQVDVDYDDQGNLAGITDRMGDTTQRSHHPETGKIASHTDAEGHTTTFNYTAQIQTFTNAANSQTFTFTLYNLARTTYADGGQEDWIYDARGNAITYSNQVGESWGYQYNERGQVIRVTYPTGGRIDYSYNADGTPASRTDSDVGITTYGYDTCKRLNQITQPGGGTVLMFYDANDQLQAITDELGRITTFDYDANGNLVEVSNPLNQATTFAYDLMDRMVDRTDPLGRTYTYGYDERGWLNSITDRGGQVWTTDYDARGWPTIFFTDPAGQPWITHHDDEGVPTAFVTPLGHTTAFQTNKLGYTTAITDPLGAATRFAYDVLGRPTAATDRVGRTTGYTYDDAGQLTGITRPVIGSITFARNGLGLLARITDLRGEDWDLGYSPMGHFTSHSDPLGNQWTYTYDEQGRLDQIAYPAGGTATLDYDAADQVIQTVYPGGPTLNYTYDNAGRLHTANNLDLSYDARGDMTNSQDGAASFGATYDAGRRIRTVTYDGQTTITYTYNTRDLLTRVEDDLAGAWMEFAYDDAGRLIEISRSNSVSTTLGYDDVSRVIRIQDGTLADQQYSLNAEGEPVQVVRSLPLDPDPSLPPLNLTFDDACQISSPGYAYDAYGRQTVAPGRLYGYDGSTRLTQVTSDTLTVNLSYNGLGDLRTRTVGGTTTAYYHNYALGLATIVAEEEGGAYKRFYVYTPGGSLLYAIDPTSGETRFYHFDRLGSTLFLSDDGGAVSDAYAYSPYGVLLGHVGSSDQPFTYVGRYGVRWEPVGNLYHMSARHYDPTTARFLTRDPAWPDLNDPQSLNPYQYGSQNPLRYIDPMGTQVLPLSQKVPIQGREAVKKIFGQVIAERDGQDIAEGEAEESVATARTVVKVIGVVKTTVRGTSTAVKVVGYIAGASKLVNAGKFIGKVGVVTIGVTAVADTSLQTYVLVTQGAAGHQKLYKDEPGARVVRMVSGETSEQQAKQVKRDLKKPWYTPAGAGSRIGSFLGGLFN